MKKRGSAIIIAMLLITTVGAVAFSISRFIFMGVSNASDYISGSVAYYAAESGIEKGFLKYRLDRNTVIPASLPASTTWLSDRTSVERVNVSTNTLTFPAHSTDSIANNAQQLFDLRIGYLGTKGKSFYGDDVDGAVGITSTDLYSSDYGKTIPGLVVLADNSVKIDLTNAGLSAHDLRFMSVIEGIDNDNEACQSMVYFKFITEDGAGNVREYKDLMSYFPNNCAAVVGVDSAKLINPSEPFSLDTASTKTLLIQENNLARIITRGGGALNLKTTLHIRPMKNNAKIALWLGGCNDGGCSDVSQNISGPLTVIESTGYYHGIARKLEANIDRQSGNLYDLYDYVIYNK